MKQKKKKISLVRFYEASVSSFLKNKRSAKKLKSKVIHDLRVDIKHLRTVLHLISEFNKNEKNIEIILKELKPVFKSAGEIRTAFLNIKLLNNAHGTFEYKAYLERLSFIGNKNFLASLKAFDTRRFKKVSGKTAGLLKPVKKQKILDEALKFIHKKELYIKRALKKKMSALVLHTIRKELKNIKATQQLLSRVTGLREFDMQVKASTKLEETIGNWHDVDVLLNGIHDFIKQGAVNENLKKYAEQLQKKEKAMMKKVLVLLKQHYN